MVALKGPCTRHDHCTNYHNVGVSSIWHLVAKSRHVHANYCFVFDGGSGGLVDCGVHLLPSLVDFLEFFCTLAAAIILKQYAIAVEKSSSTCLEAVYLRPRKFIDWSAWRQSEARQRLA